MKKTFEFKADGEKFILINTNPNEKKEKFEIDKKEMQFDTNKFYQYVFSDITAKMEIEIVDKTDEGDDQAKRLYKVVDEICVGVMKRLNDKCLAESV